MLVRKNDVLLTAGVVTGFAKREAVWVTVI